MRSILITIALAIITGGCAIGVKHDYTYADPNWDVQTDKTVAVAVHDRRSYIVDNNKTPDFVGLSRGGWGNPFDVVTASGKPLAADMTTAVVNGLKARNIKAEAVTIAPAQGPAEALLITLQEWKSDTYVATRLLYELRAQIFGADGKQLAETEFRGTDGLGSGLIPSETGKMVGPAYREKLDRIFKDTFMRDALK